MGYDFSSATYVALYIVSVHVLHTNTRTSTHWRLNAQSGKVEAAAAPMAADQGSNESSGVGSNQNDVSYHQQQPSAEISEDLVMEILTSTRRITRAGGDWLIEAEPRHCYENCEGQQQEWLRERVSEEEYTELNTTQSSSSDMRRLHDLQDSPAKLSSSTTPSSKNKKKKQTVLDCGKPVETTPFDHLRGVMNRHSLEHLAEPEVAMIFRTKGNPDVDLTVLQNQLRKAKKEKPKSSQIYNQIGNYWRIKGDTQRSVECFRKALALSPNNSDALLNLARVLFNLRYLDDAYELTRVSLATQAADQNSWLQHFTLGEILKARGRHQEAGDQFRHTLDLHPGFHPAQVHLHEIEALLASSDTFAASFSLAGGMLTYYTLFIILLLVLAVLYGILATIDGGLDEAMGGGAEAMKTPRHFNRAMAMRSIKLGINHKLMRMRRQQYGC